MPSGGVKANPAIRKIGPTSPADVENVRECFRLGLGVADTARKTGLSTNQVTRIKRDNGLTSKPPANSAQLTEASRKFSDVARTHRKSRYEAFAETFDLLNAQNLAVLKGERKPKTVLRGAMGLEEMREVDEFPARDLRDRLVSLAQLDLSMGKIEDKENDGGLTEAKSTLDKALEIAQTILANSTVRPGLIQE